MATVPTLGIDFGTTNSVCAIYNGNEADIIPTDNGNRLTPSVVYYTKDGEQHRPLIGTAAENKARENPDRVIRSIKRQMGDAQTVAVDDVDYTPQEVGSEIIREIRTNAAEQLGIDRSKLKDVVITRPAYWEEDRAKSIRQAAELAGFENIRLIKEPAAAAIAYGQYRPDVQKTVGVYDLGGGTFDFVIVDIDIQGSADPSKPGREEYKVKGPDGDPHLGGDDWDQRIIEWVADHFERRTGLDPFEAHPSDKSKIEPAIRHERVREAARDAKERLSDEHVTETDIALPFFFETDSETYSIERTLTQNEFEGLTDDLAQKTIKPMHDTLEEIGMEADDLDEIILVGGSTKMPQIQKLIHAELGQRPRADVDPSTAVAMGAAIQGSRNDVLLLEATPLSLGIALKGDRFKSMVDRNTRLPAEHTEIFTTSENGQTAVRIPVYQGERDIASENRHLKTLILDGIDPGRKQSAQVKVTFRVEKNGIINVSAVETSSNKSVSVDIEDENTLPDAYINEKIQEARDMERKDERRKRAIDARRNAEDAIENGYNMIESYPHIMDDEERRELDKKINAVKETKADHSATVADLRKVTELLREAVLDVGDRARGQNATPKTGESRHRHDRGTPAGSTTPPDKPQTADDIATGQETNDPDIETVSTDELEQEVKNSKNDDKDDEGLVDEGIFDSDDSIETPKAKPDNTRVPGEGYTEPGGTDEGDVDGEDDEDDAGAFEVSTDDAEDDEGYSASWGAGQLDAEDDADGDDDTDVSDEARGEESDETDTSDSEGSTPTEEDSEEDSKDDREDESEESEADSEEDDSDDGDEGSDGDGDTDGPLSEDEIEEATSQKTLTGEVSDDEDSLVGY